MYRILFFNFNPNAVVNIHLGFHEAGCEIMNYTSGYENKNSHIIEKNLNDLIDSFKPDIIFSYGWWINLADINTFWEVIKKRGVFHVFWAIDDPELFRMISLPVAKKSHLTFTSDLDCIKDYNENGIDAHFLLYGCHPPIHKKVIPVNEFEHDIVLLAHNYNTKWDPSYFSYRLNGVNNVLRPLVDNSFDVMVWGLWWRDPERIYNLPAKNYGSLLPPGNESNVYSSAKIILGLQTVGNSKSMLSIRTFETLCCGAFHLSQYSPALEYYFKKGIHLEWSKSREETLDLANFYLKHDSLRERIAGQGQQEVLSKHTMKHRALAALEVIKNYI